MHVSRRLDRLERRCPEHAVRDSRAEARTVFAMSENELAQVQCVYWTLVQLGSVGLPLDQDRDGRLLVTTTETIIAEAGYWEALKLFPHSTFPEFLFK